MQLQTSSFASSQNLELVGLVWKKQPIYFADCLDYQCSILELDS